VVIELRRLMRVLSPAVAPRVLLDAKARRHSTDMEDADLVARLRGPLPRALADLGFPLDPHAGRWGV